MYFTNTPSLNSMEAIMKRPPGGIQRGGGKNRSPYKYTGRDCDCRLCLYYRKKNGCALTLCPVLDIRLGCGAATIGEAAKAVFKDAKNTAFQKRLSQIYTARYPQEKKPRVPTASPPSGGLTMTEPAEATFAQEVNHAAQQEKIAKPMRTG